MRTRKLTPGVSCGRHVSDPFAVGTLSPVQSRRSLQLRNKWCINTEGEFNSIEIMLIDQSKCDVFTVPDSEGYSLAAEHDSPGLSLWTAHTCNNRTAHVHVPFTKPSNPLQYFFFFNVVTTFLQRLGSALNRRSLTSKRRS